MRKLLPILLIIALFAGAGLLFWQEHRYVSGFVEVPGQIVDLRSERVTQGDGRQYSTNAHAVVAYNLNGQLHHFSTQFFGVPKWREGENVVALVSPTKSDVGRVKRLDDLYPKSVGLAALAAVCVVVLGIGSLARKPKARPNNP